MNDVLRTRCPDCGETYRLAAEKFGRTLKCRECGSAFEAVPARAEVVGVIEVPPDATPRRRGARRAVLAAVGVVGCGVLVAVGLLLRPNKPPSVAVPSQPLAAPTQAGTAPPEVWHGLGDRVRAGEFAVVVTKATWGKVGLEGPLGFMPSAKPLLTFYVGVMNENPTLRREYRTWGAEHAGARLKNVRAVPHLVDDFGNEYEMLDFSRAGGKVFGAVSGSEMVHPGKVVVDLIVFEPPVDGATRLDLTLPGVNVGAAEPIRYRIPMSAVERGRSDGASGR